jgi:UDP-2-acetamido-3-amino-2,3-dideoxy-glucuronate N-acetyltransferase
MMEAERIPPAHSIHPTAVVEAGAVVGAGTRIWHFSHVRSGSRVGDDCSIGFSVYVDAGVAIGDRCKIQNHVSVYRGVVLEDDVFVGPGASFTNDRYPRANSTGWEIVPTSVRRGASVGANATIVSGVELGAWSTVGAGAVVTRDVPPHGLVTGAPARLCGWVCTCGRPLARLGEPPPEHCSHCGRGSTGMVPS